MPYTKTNWRNSQEPAINAANLNKMEQGIESATSIAEAAVKNKSGVPGLYSGTDAGKDNVSGQSAGDLYYATDTRAIYRWSGSAWTLFIARNHTHSSPTQVTMLDDRSIAPSTTNGFKPIARSKLQVYNYQTLYANAIHNLLNGTLYTKANPFTQSWTFSGVAPTTTTAAVTNTATSIPVAELDNLPPSGVVLIDSEQIAYASKSATTGAGTLNGCKRGYNSTTAASHASGASVGLLSFKIARGSVNQSGWVRSNVTATVNGTAATGTWVNNWQTFVFNSPPAAGTNNITITSTDVVPYQGMGVAGDQCYLVWGPTHAYSTTFGSGSNIIFTGPWNSQNAALNLPGYLQYGDDNLYCDTYSISGWSVGSARMVCLPVGPNSNPSHPTAYYKYINVYAVNTFGLQSTSGSYAKPDRGWRVWPGMGIGGVAFNTPVSACNTYSFLGKISNTGSGSVFSPGELVLVVSTWCATVTNIGIDSGYPSFACDFFRLPGGPIVES